MRTETRERETRIEAGKPRRRLRWATLLLLFVAGSAQAFEVHRHYFMTLQEMERIGVKGYPRTIIAYFAIAPDLDGCFESCYACPDPVKDALAELGVTCPTPEHEVENYYSRHHFDNMMIERGRRAVIASWVYEARQEMLGIRLDGDGDYTESGAKKFRAAMGYLGAAIHATQDFYAHSTWIECKQPDPPLWGGLMDLDCSETLDSGTSVTGLMTGCEGLSTCTTAEHSELNKDKPGSEQGGVALGGGSSGFATFYQLASGDGSDSAGEGPFAGSGLAPQHTKRVYKAFVDSQRVFSCCPMPWEKITGCGACGGPAYADFDKTSAEDKHIQKLMDAAVDDDEIEDIADDLPLSVVGLLKGFDSLSKKVVIKILKAIED